MKQESPVYDQKTAVLKQLAREALLGKSKKGGDTLSKKCSKEFILERGSKGGKNTRDMYGQEFYRWIASQRRVKLGWPKGKLRKKQPVIAAEATINRLPLTPESKEMFQRMIRVGV